MRIRRVLHEIKKSLLHVRVDVSIASGIEAASGEPLRVLLAGSTQKSAFLVNSAFRDPPETMRHRRVSIWQLNANLRDAAADCDFSIVALPQFSRGILPPHGYFVIPNWINGMVTLSPTGEVPRNRSLDSDLRLIKKHRLEPKISEAPEAFDDFYYRMHVPLIRHSHGSLALIAPYESLRKKWRSCELLTIFQDGQPISGIMIDYSVRPHKLLILGVSEPIEEHLRSGASAAVYHFAFKHLANQGHRLVDVGASQGLLNDGVMQFKKKWGMRLQGDKGDSSLLRVLHWSSATAAFLKRSPFVHKTAEGLCGTVFLEANDSVDDAWLNPTRKSYLLDGLENLILFQPSSFRASRFRAPSFQASSDNVAASARVGQRTVLAGQSWHCTRL